MLASSKSLTRVKLRYWAIRFGDYVEFRVWSKQPKRVVSKLTKIIPTTTREYYIDDKGYERWRNKTTEKKHTLVQVTYEGGKPLGIVKAAYVVQHLNIPPDRMMEIDRETKNQMLTMYKNTCMANE